MKKTKLEFTFGMILTFLFHMNSFGQGGAANNTWVLGTEYIGWSNGGYELQFHTAGTEKMRITPAGFVGIGTASSIPPVWQLEVDQAINVNISSINATTGYYMIDRNTVLHNFGNGNIFTGVGSGNFTLSTAAANSCYGTDAGASLTTGISNTFLGSDAGALNQNGNYIYFEN